MSTTLNETARRVATLAPVALLVLAACGPSNEDRVCDSWPTLTDGQTRCAAEVVAGLGYPVGQTPACDGVETTEQCRRCGEILGLSEDDFAAVHERCVVGRGAGGETRAGRTSSDPEALAAGEGGEGARISIGEGGLEILASGEGEESEEGAGAGITIGAGGIRIEGSDKASGESATIEVGPGGVQIRGSGERRERRSVTDCAELCALWPAFTSRQGECVATALEVRGFPVRSTLVCVEVETRSECRACRAALGLDDRSCQVAYEICMGR